MRFSFNLALAACLLALAGPAAAAQPNSAGSDAQLHGYVEAVAVADSDGRLVRFETPVCPRAYGLPDALNAQISERMRTVAAAAGALVMPAECKANLLLFVPKDRKHLFAELRQSRPEIFGRMSDVEISALANSADSSVAWQVLKQRGADGRELSGAWREGQPLIQESVTNSRLVPLARSVLDTSVVVLDARSVVGMTQVELADYAVMRGLAQTRDPESGTAGVATILTIFQDKQRGTAAPLSLTAMDLAYLKSLYRNASTFENPRRADLESEMKRSLPNP